MNKSRLPSLSSKPVTVLHTNRFALAGSPNNSSMAVDMFVAETLFEKVLH